MGYIEAIDNLTAPQTPLISCHYVAQPCPRHCVCLPYSTSVIPSATVSKSPLVPPYAVGILLPNSLTN
jgi:hypothetical protein